MGEASVYLAARGQEELQFQFRFDQVSREVKGP